MARPKYDITERSRRIEIIPHQERWATEFREIGTELRALLAAHAGRIDHVGSTAVPGLAAKDVIDVQITVRDLDDVDDFRRCLRESGYRERSGFRYDGTSGREDDPRALRRRYFRERDGMRRTHIHVREQGRSNQRFALLFRDYLRASSPARAAYQSVKERLAEVFPESINGYLYIKEPVMDIVYEAAEHWAAAVGWAPDDAFL